MWHVVGGEHYIKNFSSLLLLFVIYDIWRFGGKGWLTEWMNNEDACRISPATPGLLNILPELQNKSGFIGRLVSGMTVTTNKPPPPLGSHLLQIFVTKDKLPFLVDGHKNSMNLFTNLVFSWPVARCSQIISRPRRSKGLLYKHLCHSLIYSFTDL